VAKKTVDLQRFSGGGETKREKFDFIPLNQFWASMQPAQHFPIRSLFAVVDSGFLEILPIRSFCRNYFVHEALVFSAKLTSEYAVIKRVT
jgi:hypothetical protein